MPTGCPTCRHTKTVTERAEDTRNQVEGDVAGAVIQAGTIHHVTVSAVAVAGAPPPRLLPPDVTFFTGRAEELAKLDALDHARTHTGTTNSRSATAVVISAIAGAGGMGKTSLAVHWAHGVRDQFPDGQLYVDLRGFAPNPPLTPAQALDRLLRALGVPGSAIPQEVEARTGMYRSSLAGRRMLILLDNAVSTDQVRPLLPSNPSCLVLVTSRNRLSGLVARDGAHRITLDQLSPDEATDLLREIIGPNRVDTEPEATYELARHCGGLPLALRIAAERVVARPHHSIAGLAADLAGSHRLDLLAAEDDEATAVRAVFTWSYHSLPQDTARLFRLLGLHPGPTIGTAAVAALVGTSIDVVQPLLDNLVSSHLLIEVTRDRYQFHDLLRDYAAEQAIQHEPEPNRTNARHRILTWYLHSAFIAGRLIYPKSTTYLVLSEPDFDIHPLTFASRELALKWYDTEISNLLAIVHYASDHDHHDIAARLPRAMMSYLALRTLWQEGISLWTAAVASADHVRDPVLVLDTLCGLGDSYHEGGWLDEGADCFGRVLELAREIGDTRYEAMSLHVLGMTLSDQGQFAAALDHLTAALPIFQTLENKRGEALMLGMIGNICRQKRQLNNALDYLYRALTILRTSNNRWNEALCLRWLGQVFIDSHQLDAAVDHLSLSVAIYRELDDRYETARTLHFLGDTQYASGHRGQARETWREALALYDEFRVPEASELHSRLNAAARIEPTGLA